MLPRLSYILLIASALCAVVTIRLIDPAPVQNLRHKTFDSLQSLLPRPTQKSSAVRIINIDQDSLDKVGPWPWPRSRIATLITQLRKNNAAAIGLPLLFETPDPLSPDNIIKHIPANLLTAQTQHNLKNLPQNDKILAQIIKKSPIILGYKPLKTSAKNGKILSSPYQLSLKPNASHKYFSSFAKVRQSLPMFQINSKGIGALPIITNAKQSLHSIPILYRSGQAIHPSFTAEMLRIAQGASHYGLISDGDNQTTLQAQTITNLKIGDLSLPINKQGKLLLHYAKTDKSRYIPAWEILRDGVTQSQIEGRLVIISSTLPQIMPLLQTPLEQDVPQVEVLAQSLEQILQKRSLQRPSYSAYLEVAIIIAGGLMILFGVFYLGTLPLMIFTAVLISLLSGLSYVLFYSKGLLIDPVFPSLSLMALYGFARFSHFIPAKLDRLTIQDVFKQKLPSQAIQKIVNNNAPPIIDGKFTQLPLLSMQISGLETLDYDNSEPENLTTSIRALNKNNRTIIFENDGLIDYQSGDQIVALWDQPCKAAAKIPAKTLQRLCKTAIALSSAADQILATLPLDIERATNLPPISTIVLTAGTNWVGNGSDASAPNYSLFGQSSMDLTHLQAMACHYKARILTTEIYAQKLKNIPFLPFPVPSQSCASGDFVYILPLSHQKNYNAKTFKMLENLHFRLLEALKEGNVKAATTLIDQCLPLAGPDLSQAYQQLKTYI